MNPVPQVRIFSGHDRSVVEAEANRFMLRVHAIIMCVKSVTMEVTYTGNTVLYTLTVFYEEPPVE